MAVPEADRLLLPRVRTEHQVRVAPGGLGCLHLVGIVVHTSVGVGRPALAVPLREPAQQPGAKTSPSWLLQLGHDLLLLLRLLRVLDDGVPVKGRAEVHLQDGGELVRVDQVDDGHSTTHQDTKATSNEHKPEAPAKGKLDGGLFEADYEGPGGQEAVVDQVAEEQGDPGEGHQVGSVPGNHNEEQVGEHPEGKGHPEEDGGVVARLPIVPSPAEALSVHGEVLANSEDGEGETLLQGGDVVLLHLGGAHPVEPLVVVDVTRLVVDRHRLQRDVDGVEADVDSKGAHHLLSGERPVGGGDLDLGHVPRRAVLSNQDRRSHEEREGDARERGEPLASAIGFSINR